MANQLSVATGASPKHLPDTKHHRARNSNFTRRSTDTMQIDSFASTLSILLILHLSTTLVVSLADEDYYDPVYEEKNNGKAPSLQGSQRDSSGESDSEKKCDCCCGVASFKSRIVGGQFAQPHEFPWLTAMIKERRLYCAGSLITRKHILTAAHCLKGFSKEDIMLALGGHDRKDFYRGKDDEVETRKIEKVAIHPQFNASNYNNDLAIITMDKPVMFTTRIRPICLPFREGGNYTGNAAVVVGWGRTAESKPTSPFPQKVEVTVLSKSECDQSGYGPTRITDNMFCAGYLEGGKDSCQGDSGGPLHVYNKGKSTEIIGVVSWGRGCARPNFPGVYTKITNYMDFINENIESECLCSHV
ncbi:hypothetical protein J437_LFUL017782 [Ladona fulva]|uniref:Peptidase S1 domain-containing protein n=1 Tax=Ladona fulva TaxID=123851 RepID=A0A8K0KN64_LADFU|nr:hypothetical protein J437_LFUL017782 [Ladona fulva]